MEFLNASWLPTVVSAVLVWKASTGVRMFLPIHKGEFKGLPTEEQAMDAIRDAPPGYYMFPFGEMADWKKRKFEEKVKRGPNGVLII